MRRPEVKGGCSSPIHTAMSADGPIERSVVNVSSQRAAVHIECSSDCRDLPNVFGGVGIARTTGRQAAMLCKIGRMGFFCVLPRQSMVNEGAGILPCRPHALRRMRDVATPGFATCPLLLRRLGLGLTWFSENTDTEHIIIAI